VADENLSRTPLFAPENPHEVGMIECGREVGGVRITEDAQVFSYFVSNDGADADLNPVQSLAYEPPQVGIELIEINDLLKSRPRTKIAGGRIFEWDELRIQAVIANSFQPKQRTRPVWPSQRKATFA